MEYKKTEPIKLSDAGKDEKWLQDRIYEDPSILGLGDLAIIQRERPQNAGGRIDFLMYDPEDGVRYEIEVMLGRLNESHIIRTIEYWDIERRRFPALEHRAVIIAEEITNRFFNIISLMNRNIPIIAIQFNAHKYEDNLFVNFVKVLDVNEPGDEEEQGTQEVTDRKYWESRASKKSIELLDMLLGFVKQVAEPKVTYNKGHIAVGTQGRNFMWCHPRKGSHIHFEVRVGEERDNLVAALEERGIGCNKSHRGEVIKIMLTLKELNENKDLIQRVVTLGETLSHNN
jgi:hypothetical protein